MAGDERSPNVRELVPGAVRRGVSRPPTENLGARDFKGLARLSASGEVLGERRIIAGLDDPQIKAVYKMLRTRMLHRMRQNQWSVIAVTSPRQGDGKSLTSINLALSMARELTLSVILVDLDLRRPSLAKYLHVRPNYGLSDCLTGQAATRDAMFRLNDIERLAFLANLEAYEDSSETLSSPQMAGLIDELRGKHPGRILLCDVPPVLASDDLLAVSPLVDALLLVVAEGSTPRVDVMRVAEIIEDVPIAGVVLNRSVGAAAGYGYYYY